MTDKTNTFSIKHTTFVKGIAILLLVVHHYIGIKHCSTVNLFDTNIKEIIYNLSKVCVSVFAILSGFGMYKSACNVKNDIILSLKRIILILVGYWMALIVWLTKILLSGVNLDYIYEHNVVESFIRDLFGLCRIGPKTTSINSGSWFIEAIIIFYILFPLLHIIIDKLGKMDFLLPIITFIPIGLYLLDIKLFSWDSIVYYLFAFVLGMYIAKNSILDKFLKLVSNNKLSSIILLLLFIGLSVLRLVVGLPLDSIYGAMVIGCIVLLYEKNRIVDKLVIFFGKIEFFVFLFHNWMLWNMVKWLEGQRPFIILASAFTLTIVISVVFEKIYDYVKRKINTIQVFSNNRI